MSVPQVKPDFFSDFNKLKAQVAKLSRIATSTRVPDINTTALSSAQIDAALVGSSTDAQPADGWLLTDKTNNLLLARINGKWAKTTLTTIP